MRTLNADLLTAQRSASAPVYIQVVLSKAGSTTMTYTTADAYNRIVGIDEVEKQYSGKTTILLDNSDGNFNSLVTYDFRGYSVQVGWGFICAGAVNRYSNSQTLWVVEQTEISRFGKLLTQLICYDIWGMIGQSKVFSGGVKLGGVVTRTENYNPVGRKLVGQSSSAYGTVTHYQSKELLVSNVVGAFQGETAKIGTDLSIAIDSITILGTDVGGAKQYSGDTTIQTIVAALLSDWVSVPTVDTDDPLNSYTTYKPIYNVYVDASKSTTIQELLDFTLCGMRMRDSTMHVLYLSAAPSTDYTYDGVHNIAGCDRTRQLSFPNRVYVVDCDPYYAAPTWVGSYTDTDSYALLGKYIDALVVNPTVQSNADCVALALAIISRGKQSVSTGAVILPMINVGQEILDWVVLTDSRNSNLTITGRVGAINRKFEDGKLSMSIELGGLKIPANFRSYPSAVPPPASVGSSDLIQDLILATTIWVGSGHVKISPLGLCIIGDAASMSDAMIRLVSTSGLCSGSSGEIAYIWHNAGVLGLTCDGLLQLTGGAGVEAILGSGDFTISGTGVLVLPATTSDPANKPDGSVYYNSSTKKIRQLLNGSWSDLGGTTVNAGTSCSTYSAAQRVSGATYTNGTNIRVVSIYNHSTTTGGVYTIVVNGTIILRVMDNYNGACATFIVGKGQTYVVNYFANTDASFTWSETGITGI